MDLNDGLCRTGLNTCSVRAAVMQANATAEEDTIVLQAGQIYPLVLNAPGDEDDAAQDDLDVSSTILIDGNGGTIQVGPVGRPPTCNLNGTEELAWEFRVFHVLPAGELVLDSVTVRNGCADGSGAIAQGGGIFNGGKLTIRSSTVAANRAGSGGGGLYNLGYVTVVNSTFSGNQASTGGGIETKYWELKGSFVTIVENSASDTGGGLLARFPSRGVLVMMKNSIVANNVAGAERTNNCWLLSDVSEPWWFTTGTNLAGGGNCRSFTDTSQLNLGPLANNGGLTETHALLPGSEAIDATSDCTDVDGTTVSHDQRGVARPRGSAEPPKCDVGAYEWDPDIPTPHTHSDPDRRTNGVPRFHHLLPHRNPYGHSDSDRHANAIAKRCSDPFSVPYGGESDRHANAIAKPCSDAFSVPYGGESDRHANGPRKPYSDAYTAPHSRGSVSALSSRPSTRLRPAAAQQAHDS